MSYHRLLLQAVLNKKAAAGDIKTTTDGEDKIKIMHQQHQVMYCTLSLPYITVVNIKQNVWSRTVGSIIYRSSWPVWSLRAWFFKPQTS